MQTHDRQSLFGPSHGRVRRGFLSVKVDTRGTVVDVIMVTDLFDDLGVLLISFIGVGVMFTNSVIV